MACTIQFFVESSEAWWIERESQTSGRAGAEANEAGTQQMPVSVLGFEGFERVLGGFANVFVVAFGRFAECPHDQRIGSPGFCQGIDDLHAHLWVCIFKTSPENGGRLASDIGVGR